MTPLRGVPRTIVLALVVMAVACGGRPHVTSSPTDSVAGVLEIANGYGGKLLILSNPKITPPLRNLVRVDSFYVDSTRRGANIIPPQYRLLLRWPSSKGTDTIDGNPILITNGRLRGSEVHRSALFNANTQRRVLVADDIATIGVLAPAAAVAKYGALGRNGAIVMTTKREEQPDEQSQFISDRAALQEAASDTGIVDIRYIVDTTGRVDPSSFVVICRRTPGAFIESAKKEAILKEVWKPARLHGRPVREKHYFGLRTPVDSAERAGDIIPLCVGGSY